MGSQPINQTAAVWYPEIIAFRENKLSDSRGMSFLGGGEVEASCFDAEACGGIVGLTRRGLLSSCEGVVLSGVPHSPQNRIFSSGMASPQLPQN